MNDNWYFLDPTSLADDKRVGPISLDEMQKNAQEGKISDDTLVWNPGLINWQFWKNANPSPISLTSPPQANPPNAEPIPQTQPQSAPLVLDYAPFGIRLAAMLIDLLVLGVFNAILFAIYKLFFRLPDQLLENSIMINIPGLLLDAVYHIYFLSQFGGTPGKMLLGLKVVKKSGESLDFGLATCRYFSLWLSALSFGIGFLVIFVDPKRRALHDHLCKTSVIFWKPQLHDLRN